MELSLRAVFQDFNASKFVVYLSVLVFTILFALRLDGTITVSYIFVFLPLWLWKLVALSGSLVGCVSHCKYPPARNDISSEVDFRAMILSAGEHMLLLTFELLACYKLEIEPIQALPDHQTQPMWIIVFVPLFFECTISIVICIWSVRQDKSFEFELFFSVNVLQFVFLALKLDKIVDWNWAIVFIPLWILICLSLIGVLYAIILAVLLIRSIELLPEHRRQHVYSAVGYTFLVVPILIFLVLITGKLDSIEQNRMDDAAKMPFAVVCTPLYVSLLCLMLMAIGAKGGNSWWFGMRRDFCVFLLDACPCLQEYGNVSYKFGGSGRSESRRVPQRDPDEEDGAHSGGRALNAVAGNAPVRHDMRPIIPALTIECPD
uniref:Transmembrane protein 185A n=1 Tax=Plectus sambesii TaxID=2011161 RepID=A0A914XAS8_9BILA